MTLEFRGLAFELLIYASKREQQLKLSTISRFQCIDVLRSALASLFPVGKTVVEVDELRLLPYLGPDQKV